MADDLEMAVLRFCAQLEREGYQADHEMVGDVHVIAARPRSGGAVLRYVASRKDGAVQIEEVSEVEW